MHGFAVADLAIQTGCCVGFHLLAQALLWGALLVGYLHRRWRRGGGCGGGGSGRLLPVVKSPGVPDVHHGSSSISGSGAGSSGAGSSSGAGGWLQPRPLMLGAAVMAVWSVVNLAVTSQL
ncbi:hypothetical protein CHLRE_11g467551v5 [Chlamydomonas reinhardtii]|uniref:Uncharacterized protein n=1 Tax=Chlamydomonas reinhardtii TaxID=3055 RepID=A0A2K3D785_CHLRE|nr:uncharacterized protein CHLRE_11g467551v5 [Chlamydomonas reinhardtii]PNW76395.1 hypothetical protein CHLRE_11g467551v5 [Chlamydomonas reinhardtii]